MTTGSESRTCCPANRVMSASSPTTIADWSKRCSTATAPEFLGAICRNGLATGRTLTSGSAAEPIKGTSRNAGGRGDAGGWAECLKRSGENGREDSKQPSSRRSRPRCVFQPTGSDCQPIGYRGRISTAAHFGAGCRRWRDRPSSSSRGVHGHRIRYRRLWSDRVQGWHRLP